MSDIKAKRCRFCDWEPSVELDDTTTVCCVNDSCIMSNLEECEVEEWNKRNTPNEDLIEENAKLKADKAKLVDALESTLWLTKMSESNFLKFEKLIQKHKEPNNGN